MLIAIRAISVVLRSSLNPLQVYNKDLSDIILCKKKKKTGFLSRNCQETKKGGKVVLRTTKAQKTKILSILCNCYSDVNVKFSSKIEIN